MQSDVQDPPTGNQLVKVNQHITDENKGEFKLQKFSLQKTSKRMNVNAEKDACKNNIKYDMCIYIYTHNMKCYHNFHTFSFKIIVTNTRKNNKQKTSSGGKKFGFMKNQESVKLTHRK